jgi:hypothetical protein
MGRLSHVDESGIALVDISINWQRILTIKGLLICVLKSYIIYFHAEHEIYKSKLKSNFALLALFGKSL